MVQFRLDHNTKTVSWSGEGGGIYTGGFRETGPNSACQWSYKAFFLWSCVHTVLCSWSHNCPGLPSSGWDFLQILFFLALFAGLPDTDASWCVTVIMGRCRNETMKCFSLSILYMYNYSDQSSMDQLSHVLPIWVQLLCTVYCNPHA